MTGFVGNTEKLTEKNKYFRQVLFTGKYAQLVVMCLKASEEIGNEVMIKWISSFASRRAMLSSSSAALRNTWSTKGMQPLPSLMQACNHRLHAALSYRFIRSPLSDLSDISQPYP